MRVLGLVLLAWAIVEVVDWIFAAPWDDTVVTHTDTAATATPSPVVPVADTTHNPDLNGWWV